MKQKNKRKFIFIDESGDPGFYGGSEIFAYNIILLGEKDLAFLTSELARYWYMEEKYSELKNYTKNNQKLLKMLEKISQKVDIKTYYFYKKDFQGTARGTIFRNYILRKSLENFFVQYFSDNDKYDQQNLPKFEIIIDRYLDGNKKDREEFELKKYLNDNYRLPKINHITMVDSRYTPAIQILDIVSEYFSDIKYQVENNELNIELIELFKK